MVQSGLVNNPHVSHFRLAAHLCLAFLIFSLIFKEIIRIKYPCRSDTSWAIRLVLVALSFQIVFGAFTAGLDAGTYYGTYPKMGSDWFPQAAFMFDGLFNNALNNPIMIQWIHRWAAVVVVIGVVGLFFLFRNSRPLKPVAAVGVILVAAQFGLGVATILTSVWLPVALLHQLGALILLAVLVLLGHRQSYAAIADKTGTDPALSCTEN
jgi:cytochrome c oxidase assembly protein subunit 15